MTDQENAKLDKLIEEVEKDHELTGKIYYGLFGVPGTDDTGLCGEFNALKKDYYNFRRICFIVLGVLIGSGVISVSVWEVIK